MKTIKIKTKYEGILIYNAEQLERLKFQEFTKKGEENVLAIINFKDGTGYHAARLYKQRDCEDEDTKYNKKKEEFKNIIEHYLFNFEDIKNVEFTEDERTLKVKTNMMINDRTIDILN